MIMDVGNKIYEELVELHQNGDITLVEFVEAQPNLSDDWAEWKHTHPETDESANAFLGMVEGKLYE
jgi:hypothetical protein